MSIRTGFPRRLREIGVFPALNVIETEEEESYEAHADATICEC